MYIWLSSCWFCLLYLLYFSFLLNNSPFIASNKLVLHFKRAHVRHLWCTSVSTSFGRAKCLRQSKNRKYILRHFDIPPLRWHVCYKAALTISTGEQLGYLRWLRESRSISKIYKFLRREQILLLCGRLTITPSSSCPMTSHGSSGARSAH